MNRRKTVCVSSILEDVNHLLATNVVSPESRWVAISLLEKILHDTGNYRGFGYLNHKDVPVNQKPGIQVDDLGNTLPYEQRFVNCDETRRFYLA